LVVSTSYSDYSPTFVSTIMTLGIIETVIRYLLNEEIFKYYININKYFLNLLLYYPILYYCVITHYEYSGFIFLFIYVILVDYLKPIYNNFIIN